MLMFNFSDVMQARKQNSISIVCSGNLVFNHAAKKKGFFPLVKLSHILQSVTV